MIADNGQDGGQVRDGRQNGRTLDGVRFHVLVLFPGQASRLAQHRVQDADLADVVQAAADLNLLAGLGRELHLLGQEQGIAGHALRVSGGIGVAHFDRLSQGNDRLHEPGALLGKEELSTFNAARHARRQSIGQMQLLDAEGFVSGSAVEVEHAQPPGGRAQEGAEDGTHLAAPDAIGAAQVRVPVRVAGEQGFAAGQAALGQRRAIAGGLANAGNRDRGLEGQLPGRFIHEQQGAAAGVEGADSVLEILVEQLLNRFMVVEVLAEAEQLQELGAGARILRHVAGDNLERFRPAMLRRGLHVHGNVVGLRRARPHLVHADHAEHEVADLQQIALAKAASFRANADAVQEGAVGAAQVTGIPTLLIQAGQLGVTAADGPVAELDLPWLLATDAEQIQSFPGPAFDLATHTA